MEIFLSLYDNIQHKDSENPRFKPIKKFCRHNIQNKNGFLDLNREHSYNFLFDSIPTIFLFLVTKPYFLIQLTGVVKLVQTQEFLPRKNELVLPRLSIGGICKLSHKYLPLGKSIYNETMNNTFLPAFIKAEDCHFLKILFATEPTCLVLLWFILQALSLQTGDFY